MTNLDSDMTFPTYGGEVKPATGATLFALGSWLRRGKASADARQLFLEGGRDGDSFYRDRWSYDKIVRSTHGVNCTGSCSWKIYVKDGVITWETQQTDYPSTGADMPEYEPRGCPRGAAFSWYEYSPTRIKYPYVRGVLLDMFRDAKKRLGDPVDAWAAVVEDPEKARAYKSQRGRGGMVRVSWEEAMEIVASAYVHTIKQYGPDRIAGFSVIPAMSMISYGAGARFHELIGATMLSFYDWYADLPPASPQVFGDQTDVPEAGDWFNSQYLIMWGTNLPLTRTPDAHFMAEARYHGQKVVVVSPDFADNTKFADDWLRVQPGTDGALAQAMGHVILKEFHVGKREPMFLDYMTRYTDSPFLVEIGEVGEGAHEGIEATTLVPGKFLTAAKMPAGTTERTENNEFRPLVIEADGTVKDPGGTLADRFGEEGAGHWNLNLDGVEPVMSIMDTNEWEPVEIALPRFDLPAADGQASVGGGYVLRGVPARRVNGRLVTTVYDIMLAHYAVEREGLPGQWPTDYMDASMPGTPAWQEEFTSVPAGAAIKIGREFAQNAVETQGRSMILMGAGTNHYYHSDQMYRTFLAAHGNVWHPGPQRWRLGPLRGSGEGPTDHGLGFLYLRPGLGAPAAPDDLHRLVLHDHRPVALRRGLGLGDGEPDQVLAPGRQTAGRHARRVRPARLDALLPDVLQGFDPAGSRGRRGRYRPGRVRLPGAARGPPSVRDRGPGRPPQRSEDPRELAYEPAWFVREGHRVLPPPHAGHRQRSQRGRAARGCPPQDRQLARRSPRQARPHVGGGLP